MTRKCTYCRSQIPKLKDCTDLYQKAGFCNKTCKVEHLTNKALAAMQAKYDKARRKSNEMAKQARREQREAKEKLKTKADYAKEAQQAFNAYIRERDRGLPCISCDKPDNGTHQRHASHYRSRGACPELAFDPLNVHASCAQCNSMKSGNIVEYRIRLQEKIGAKSLEWLEGPHEPKRYTIDDLKQIKTKYRKLARELIKEREDV